MIITQVKSVYEFDSGLIYSKKWDVCNKLLDRGAVDVIIEDWIRAKKNEINNCNER